MKRIVTAIVVLVLMATHAEATGFFWDPEAFAKEDTLELLTVGPEEGEHWFKVWLVVLDGQVYVRLGNRAVSRVKRNTRAPLLSVRVAGREFERVRGEPAPEIAVRVAEAMAEKYWSDIFVRHFEHPLTLRLVPVED